MRRLLLVAVLGAVVVGATSCDVSPPAATVDGVTISQSMLNGVLSTEINDPHAQCAAQILAGQTKSPVGIGTEGDGTTANAVSPAFADAQLFSMVLQEIETQALARRGVAVTAADVAAARIDYPGQLQQQQSQTGSPSGCSLNTATPLAKQLPAGFLQKQAEILAAQEQFEVAVGHVNVSPSALTSYYDSHRSLVTQECLNIILADSQAAAQTLHDEIAAGTSFPAAAKAAGADQQATPPNGELQCGYPTGLNSQLGATLGATVDALQAGQLSEPLTWQTTNPQTGAPTTFYLVVQMRQHYLVPFATLRDQIRQAILAQNSATVGVLLHQAVARAQVTVDPRYGSWDPAHGITAPTPPPPAFVPNAKANVPAPLLNLGGLTLNPASG
ncbi:MAG TPA: hypothetical protein VN799_02390 [Acidimicrobiales bacterium]|nr:hypothetical protein [Acidimicrobiales bacterium]